MTEEINPTTKLAAELVECGDKIDALNESLKKLNAEWDIREKLLLEKYDLEKVASVDVIVNGSKRSVGRMKKFWARKKDDAAFTNEDVYNALILDGIPTLAKKTFDIKSLTAYFKEALQEEGSSIPPHLAKYIDAKEVPSISIRKK